MKWFEVAITSTDTRASDGVAERRGAMTAILRRGEGVKRLMGWRLENLRGRLGNLRKAFAATPARQPHHTVCSSSSFQQH